MQQFNEKGNKEPEGTAFQVQQYRSSYFSFGFLCFTLHAITLSNSFMEAV